MKVMKKEVRPVFKSHSCEAEKNLEKGAIKKKRKLNMKFNE